MSANILTVAGAKGGVGKTTVAFYMALALAKRGCSVVIVDLDLGFRCQSVLFGVESDVVYDLSDLLTCETFDLDKALKKCCFNDKIFLIPSCADPFAKLNFDKLATICSALRTRFDYVILDAPPSISRGFIAAITLSDSAVLVTTPDIMSAKAATLCAQIMVKAGVKNQRLIINKVPLKTKLPPVIDDFDKILDDIGVQLLGVVPFYEGLDLLAQNAKPPHPKADFMLAFENISKRLNGEEIQILIG